MKILIYIPESAQVKNVVRDVLYGCWCKGNRIGGGTVPPLVLLTIATILKEDGHEVVFIDALNSPVPSRVLDHAITDCGMVIMLTSTMSIHEDIETLALLKQKNPAMNSVICGSHPTFLPEFCLNNPQVDIVARKEPDFTIRDLSRVFSTHTISWKSIPGISYKENNVIINNPDYPLITDLNQIPIADRTLLPSNPRYYNPLISKYPYTTSVTSRGCQGKCSFCTIPYFYGGEIRAWSVEKVIEEIRLIKKLGFHELYYRDETFTFSKPRTQAICEAIIKEKVAIRWLCNVRVGSVDYDTLAHMKKAGCRLIKVGVESGSQEILDASRKGISIEATKELFRWAKKLRIATHAHLMFGMPQETAHTLKTTVRFLRKISPGTMDIGICTPYPGSELYANLVKKHPELVDQSTLDLGTLHTRALFNKYFTRINEGEIEKWLTIAYRSFYLRPSYIISRLLNVTSFKNLLSLTHAGLHVLRFSIWGDKADEKK